MHNSSTVFCTMLDATKAFDRVECCRLFRLLIDRGLPPVVVRLLVNLYTNHITRIACNGVLSSSFEVLNGVKQGAVLSPVLFFVSILTGYLLHLRMLVLDVILDLSLLVCWHTLLI